MTSQKKLLEDKTRFRRAILGWYGRQKRDLPSRRNPSPYMVWLAEIIFQQTRIDQGLPYLERFVKTFPTVKVLAAANLDDVLKAWEGLGYYARARNLHKAARIVVAQRQGRFPETAADWRQLPGVGPYTAGAIASIAFGEEAAAVDGNVKRVLARLINLRKSIDDTKTTERLWDLARTLVRGRTPGDFNQAMMELGARVCTPKKPRCPDCPVEKFCASRAAGAQERLPVRTKKKIAPHHEIVVAVIKRKGRYLLGKRPPNGLLGGLWEFPGGKVDPGENHEQALRREIAEELGVHIRVGELVASVNHAYSHFKVTLNVYVCDVVKGTPRPKTHTELKWVYKAHFHKYAFPKANHKFLPLLSSWESRGSQTRSTAKKDH